MKTKSSQKNFFLESVFLLSSRRIKSLNSHVTHTYLIGTSFKDLVLARRLSLKSIIIIRNKKFFSKAHPDYYIKDLSDLSYINSQKKHLIMFKEIDISRCPLGNKLTKVEKLLLQNHFRRIQQHCIVMGKFMNLQAKLLKANLDDWETTGILHDIDYSRAYE